MLGKKDTDGTNEKRKKAQKEPQYYRAASGEQVLNYNVYYMGAVEKIFYFVLAFAVGAAVGLLFYGGIGKNEYREATTLTYVLDSIIIVLAGGLSGKFFIPIRTNQLKMSRQHKLRAQFRDMLEALSTAIGAGQNVRDAFYTVYGDLKNQYEEDAYILQELKVINNGLNNGINIEDLLMDFGRRSGCGDIKDFAEVFEICYRQGGNIKDTVRITSEILTDKMSVAEDIETTVSGSKNEQNIMIIMPIVLVGMIKLSSPEFGSNFTTVSGIISTTIGVGLFIASYLLGTKILAIKV